MPQTRTHQPKFVLHPCNALELTMRDALEYVCDAAIYFSYNPHSECLQILSISPPSGPECILDREIASIHPIEPHRSSNVLDFLLQRESKLSLGQACHNVS